MIFATLFSTLAQAVPATSPAPQKSPGWFDLLASPMFPLLVGFAVLYFFIIRGKKNQERQRTNMLDQLKRGDRVQTIGGILGTVVEVRDTEVLLKVDETNNTKMKFTRSAIHRILEEDKAEKSA